MNHSPFWPLVWKEYRAGRAFWLAMAGMGLVAQGGVAWLAHQPADRNWWLYGIALMISAGFAVGIGGTLFAVEHEERTFALMRILPLGAKVLGAAKILCALAGLAGLLAVLWLTAGAMTGWQSLSPHDAGRLWGLWGLACLEGMAWGVLCSLVFSSPLRATVIALLAVTLSIQAAVILTSRHDLADIAAYSEAIPFRLVLLLIVGGLDAWLMPRWLAGRVPHAPAQRPTAKTGRRGKAYAAWRSPAPRWSVPLGHLMWQAWREVVGSAWPLAGVVVVSLVVSFLVLAVMGGVLHVGEDWLRPPTVGGLRLIPWFALLPLVLVTSLSGSLVFRVDPTSGARFLAERGVSSRALWVARQTVWGGWLIVLLLAVACVSIVPRFMPAPEVLDALPRTPQINQYYNEWISIARSQPIQRAISEVTNRNVALNALMAWEVLFSTFAVAQLTSLVVRRRLLAAVFSAVLGMIASGWTYLMFAIDVPAWWSVLPLGAGCLLATWLRTPAWLLARGGWRGWILPAAVVVTPLAFLAIAVPRYRADEIPPLFTAVLPPVAHKTVHASELDWPADDTSPAAIADVKAALALYQRAYDVFLAGRHEWGDAEQQQTADLLLEASRYRSTWLPSDPQASWRMAIPIHRLGDWLGIWANTCQRRGQLDKALSAYLAALRAMSHFDECAAHWGANAYDQSTRSKILEGLRSWAAAPGQTPEQLHAAIGQLDESHRPLSGEVRLRSWYFATTFAITHFPVEPNDITKPRAFSSECWITGQLPWERERALHLASFIASAQLDAIRGIESRLSRQDAEQLTGKPNDRVRWEGVGDLLTPLFQYAPWNWNQFRTTDPRFDDANQWLRTTPLVTEQSLGSLPATWSLVAEETDWRATKIVLALEAWKTEHGQLPDALQQLVPAELAFVPVDPVWSESFLYYPQGLPAPPDDRILVSSSEELPEAEKELQEQHRPARVIDWPKIGRRPFLWSALSPIPGVQPVVTKSLHYASQNVATYYDLEANEQRWWYPRVPENGVLQAGQAYVIGLAEDAQEKPRGSDSQ